MNRIHILALWLACTAGPALADDTSGETPGTVGMEWETTPESPPPHAWVGPGMSWSTAGQTHGGAPWGVGVDFTWLTVTSSLYHTLRFSHRTWRAPSPEVEQRLKGEGVTEGVQTYWAGRMVLKGLTKFVNPQKQEPHFGMQLGWLAQRTQHVGPRVQRYLLREHDLYWGPLWAVHMGGELHAGYYKAEETFHLSTFFRLLNPIAARMNRRGEGVVLDGKMWDPIETVAPESEVGISIGGRSDPHFYRLQLGARVMQPSVVQESRNRDWARIMGHADLSVTTAF